MNKLKIVGVRNISLLEPFTPDRNKDYFLGLIVGWESTESFPIDDGEPELVFKLKIDRPEVLKEVGGKGIQVGKGFSKGQIQRFAITEMLSRIGKDADEEGYGKAMDIILSWINAIESLDDLNKLQELTFKRI